MSVSYVIRSTIYVQLPGIIPFVAFSPRKEESYFLHLVPDLALVPQVGNDLGERLNLVIQSCLDAGFTQVVVMNSDSPTLPSAYITQAFEQLSDPDVDIVFGPCEDGGYYLIGWQYELSRTVLRRVLCEVEMSTPRVLEQSLAIARQEYLRVGLLPTWYDVDTADDLIRLQQDALPGTHTYQFLADCTYEDGCYHPRSE